MDNSISPDNRTSSDDRKQSPPAFLDLADSVRLFPFCGISLVLKSSSYVQAARLGTNMPELSAVSFDLDA